MSVGLAVVVVGAMAAGCSGGEARSTVSLPPLSTIRPPTTVVGPATEPAPSPSTRVGQPRGSASADTTPPPVLRATGHDYAAIADSLFTYLDWVYAHRPDPQLATGAIQRGTTVFEKAEADLAMLRSKHQTVVSIGKTLTFTVAGVYDSMVTLRVRETILEDRTFDRDHHLVKTERFPGPDRLANIFILSDSTGRWRIGDVTTVSADPSIVIAR